MNELYPIFLRPDKVSVLIVGGGMVGTEKLSLILKNSPSAKITVVALEINKEILSLAKQHTQIKLHKKSFEPNDLSGHNIVIAGTNIPELNAAIQQAAKEKGILANIADTPALCDFYLGSIVTKGDLKLAISTNGKSPTFAKRLRELLEEVLPEEIPDILQQMESIRKELTGDFSDKVKELDRITKILSHPKK